MQQFGQGRRVRQLELRGPPRQHEPGGLAGQPERDVHSGRGGGGGDRESLGTPLRGVRPGGGLDDESAGHGAQHRMAGMVTEIGFVSLLVAGLGALAGGLVYLAVRISRGNL
ncbi:hypothetical protein GCM10012279_34150 [Micromonospora yangpuensis]|nr:hypothetical protein GCM10012279_34150 [Micromonospora yangpuensis]